MDKLANNAGSLNYEEFRNPISIDTNIADQYGEYSLDAVDYKLTKMLDNDLYDIYIKCPFYEKYRNNSRIEKADIVEMYYYFKDILIQYNKYTNIDIFKRFAEFFEINYEFLYKQLGVSDKSNILKELNDNVKIKNRNRNKKLF